MVVWMLCECCVTCSCPLPQRCISGAVDAVTPLADPPSSSPFVVVDVERCVSELSALP